MNDQPVGHSYTQGCHHNSCAGVMHRLPTGTQLQHKEPQKEQNI